MPNKARNHLDMLQICCGICGQKKNLQNLTPISDKVLSQIKSIDGYKNYDINDDRYPKMICEIHRRAVRERVQNPNKSSYNFGLPSDIPQYQNISLCPVTRATPLGLTEGHTCFLCDKNLVGRPKNLKRITMHLVIFALNVYNRLVEGLNTHA